MNTTFLLAPALLSTGVVYGTDVFFAIAGKKAAAASRDASVADLLGHTHRVADKRMPFIGVTSLVTTLLYALTSGRLLWPGVALVLLLGHLALYLSIAKPINARLTSAAVQGTTPTDTRALQVRWDGIIGYRAVLLTLAMLALIGEALAR
ncbi:DUF1772 domain-containing protein [Dinghuibacter silviterrae]|uniref:Uncharacterized protein DUF1772 n=1 Tax=Dinghuibacter silviterrae TaxID=1539049 RepID=A0A4R8DID2_9BACT|nr:DUF1772 domain-containing protein [Dinghuibacter silviterrae]TDW96730.1 uncharacterized protein DUF1772 [Dinghuibacter silviterrae]